MTQQTQVPAKRPADEGKLSVWLNDPEVRTRLSASLGDAISEESFAAQMLIAMQDPKLAKCTNASKLKAIHDCATLGLLPTLQQVALIPYGDSIKAMPQWQGYKALMERHPDVLEVEAVLVHVTDQYEFRDGEFHHSFDPLDGARQFNSIKDCKGGYARILYRTGRPPKLHFVTGADIEKSQRCAQTQDVWNRWWGPMALKSVYRNAYARRAVPIDPLAQQRLQRIMDHDDEVMGNDPRRVQYGPSPMAGMVRNLRSTSPPVVVDHAPVEEDQHPAPSQEQQPDDIVAFWKKAIDDAVKTCSKQKLAPALRKIHAEVSRPEAEITPEHIAAIEAHLEENGLVFEQADGSLFEKGSPAL